MKYTTVKADQLNDMMHNFALKHGLSVCFDLYCKSEDGREYSQFNFINKVGKTERYRFYWNNEVSLSDGAAIIYADLINRFGLATIREEPFAIQDVIFHDPATIIKWADGTKTVVKTQNGETYDPEKGLAMAIAKKALGNKGNYYNEMMKWLGEYDEPIEYPNIPNLLVKLSASFNPNQITELRDKIFRELIAGKRVGNLKEELNKIYGTSAFSKKDVVDDVNESIENTFTKDSLN